MVRSVLAAAGLALPLLLVAGAVTSLSHGEPLIWVSLLAAATGLALVFGLSVAARR